MRDATLEKWLGKKMLKAMRFGTPITLLNGKDLAGWKLVNPNTKNGWSVADGYHFM
ncbi:MAG: DUF1080 domain-containing protein [Bacteroidales bacterium]|jgi:hypothetical protein|nr:DUF1080 domain-containing protein [Bacteroidales bacterium]